MSIISEQFIDQLSELIGKILNNDNSNDSNIFQRKKYKTFEYKCLNESICYQLSKHFDDLIEEKSNETKLNSWLNNNVDVIPDEYEGGFKIWEGLFDLIDFFEQDQQQFFKNLMNDDDDDSNELTICDLGCGSGLLSLYLMEIFRDSNRKFRIYLQDYNEHVLKFFTIPTLLINNITNEQFKTHFSFIHGDWSNVDESFQMNHIKFNLILTAETIYNENNYEKLLNLFKRNLKPANGKVLVASKSHYFGIGGGTYSFLDFIDQQISKSSDELTLSGDIVQEIDASLLRHIIELRFLLKSN